MSGTALYFPPEIPLWSPPGDVWALGATIHYLCTSQPPRDFSAPQTGFADMYAWAASLTYAVIAIDVEPERRTIVPMDGWALASWNVHVYPAKLASFMYHMLNFSAGQRITAVELVEEVGEVLMGVYMSMGYEDMDREEREMWDMVARSAL
jgi:serine/threonine protein kinase